MYSYTWDIETGGILLNTTPLLFSKEPRPVYYKELDILGFDKFWNYKKDDTKPYMWAEANSYYYYGRLVAKTKGGSVYKAPEIEIVDEPEQNNKPLKQVNINKMIEKNNEILEALEQETIKKLYNTYLEYKKKIDIFYVAFSGGKDSIVALDIVQRTLPHNNFKVLFGDTGMEFPDTYDVVNNVKKYCKEQDIDFVTAKSVYEPEDTWNKFGPPATVTRWCCSVHKTVPQIITLREILNKPDFTGMAFIGVRSDESLSRSSYKYCSVGEKHKGQYSCNPILVWNSAEIYLYIFKHKLIFNETYKKGNRRAGCLVCPRAAERNDYMTRTLYQNEFDKFLNIIKNLYRKTFSTEKKLNEFIANGGWKARKNGRDIEVKINYKDIINDDYHILTIENPNTDWKVWIKTIGILLNDFSPYKILYKNNEYSFSLNNIKNGYEIKIEAKTAKSNPEFVKLLKNVFKKSASCVMCKECEADCHNGNIKMDNNKLEISDRCTHCAQCHKVEKGCLVYKSLEMPKGGVRMQKNKSLNCYSHHAPKIDWFKQFFKYKENFDENHTLGSQMFSFFKRFLRDADLISLKCKYTSFAKKIEQLGLDNQLSWALMLVNLAQTPQINWYLHNVSPNEKCKKGYFISMITDTGANETAAKDIWAAMNRFVELPFSDVGLGFIAPDKKNPAIVRTKWNNLDPRVILYGLYKFAEACDNYYQFTLTRLLNYNAESKGMSPTEIFGIERKQMQEILQGLSVNYPEYIVATFNLDLDTITLRDDKKSEDVLELFN